MYTHSSVYVEGMVPKPAADTRARIIDAAFALFFRSGFVRVGVDAVAERARITKRTLYYHFDSKDALLAAVLESHHEQALATIRGWSATLPADAPSMLRWLFREIGSWAERPKWSGAGFTRMVMELADQPGHPARAIARRHKARIEGWLASELEARGVATPADAARQVMLLTEGCMSLLLVHRDRHYVEVAAEAAVRLVAAGRPSRQRQYARNVSQAMAAP